MFVQVQKAYSFEEEKTTVNCIGAEWLSNSTFADTEIADNMVRYEYVEPIAINDGLTFLAKVTNQEFIQAVTTVAKRLNSERIYLDYYEDMIIAGLVEEYDETNLEMTLIYCELLTDCYDTVTKVKHTTSGIYYKDTEYHYHYTI